MAIFKNFLLMFTVLIFVGFNLGCGDDVEPSSFTSASSSGGGDSAPTLDNTRIFFALESPFTYYINSSVWNQTCEIAESVSSNTVMNCIIDIKETDLYVNEIKLQYNFPASMCEYVSYSVPWHWNYSSGTGPSEVIVSLDRDTDPPTLASSDPTGTGCSVRLHDGTYAACSTSDELKPLGADFKASCIYDYTNEDGKPNCCFGDYQYIVHTDNDNDGTPEAVETNQENWGGEVKNCIGGHGRSDWNTFSANGYPIGEIVSALDGLSNNFILKANAKSTVTNFSYQANYFEVIGTPHNHDGYETATTSNLPYAVEPLDDLDGSPMISGNPNYLFSCKDSGGETIHQVSLAIREWNTLEDFNNYAASNGLTINPDTVGVEGTDCDYDSIFVGTQCNDFLDFFDILTNAGGAYPTDNTVPSPNSIRRTYFPEVDGYQ